MLCEEIERRVGPLDFRNAQLSGTQSNLAQPLAISKIHHKGVGDARIEEGAVVAEVRCIDAIPASPGDEGTVVAMVINRGLQIAVSDLGPDVEVLGHRAFKAHRELVLKVPFHVECRHGPWIFGLPELVVVGINRTKRCQTRWLSQGIDARVRKVLKGVERSTRSTHSHIGRKRHVIAPKTTEDLERLVPKRIKRT